MPQATPASPPQDFLDGAMASVKLWAEDSEPSPALDTARQAVQHVHAKHSQQVSQHASASHVSLPEPLQALMVAAVRELTGNASFQPFSSDLAHSSSSAPSQPASSKPQSAPRRSGRAPNPVKKYWVVPSAAPGGGPSDTPQDPLPTASFPQCQWPQGETEAGGTICSSAN